MKKWISIMLAAAFAVASVNAIAQDKDAKKDAKKDGKATAEAKKSDKKKGGDKGEAKK